MESFFYQNDNQQFTLFASPKRWIYELLIDIQTAKKYIYIETFRLNDDEVGESIANALMARAAEGIDVKLIVDSWGTKHTALFDKMTASGVKVRFFKKIVLSVALFSKNHERNHRKIIAIDDKISYIGSANFSLYSMTWRESILRMEDDITAIFRRIFMENFKLYRKQFKRRKYNKTIVYKQMQIIRESPSIRHQRVRKYFINLIEKTSHSLVIVTPYFLPGKTIRNKLIKAVRRGVKVTVIIPQKSDVAIADYLRNLTLGNLYRHGVQIMYYPNHNIHAKLMLSDESTFSIGSSNFDYRSFRYMYEINLSGKEKTISSLVSAYIEDTLKYCEPFSYIKWRFRSIIQKLIGVCLIPFRKLL